MAITNHERVGKALELLKLGMIPFVERELKVVHGDQWQKVAMKSIRDERAIGKDGQVNWDTQNLLTLIWDQWHKVFKETFGYAEEALVRELRDIRNRWAHQEAFSTDDTYRALDSVGRLLEAVSAEESSELEKWKMELLRTRFDEQRRGKMRQKSFMPVEGTPSGGLQPWREIVAPHPDVASGNYQQAEFAADLWQVYAGEGSTEYHNPTEFFRRTFLTDGLRNLLISALKRLKGEGGDPVIELQTNFGGGKTHSMLALWHLFSGAAPKDLPGVEELVSESGLDVAKDVQRAVLVGTRISPGQPHTKPDGTVIRTLWGELAWQLGGKDGYTLVEEADRTATNPGAALTDLLELCSPCLILIDEWVAYARQLHDEQVLPAGTFSTHFTFAQTLTECVKSVPNAMLVLSVPASDNEIGGERGHSALDRIRNAIGRVEASWRPATTDESFEIIRRRLFEPIADNQLFIQQDAVARAFSDLYGAQHQEFPPGCREAEYERRMKAAYPIHPELFDRLFSDWSSLDKFQRTRGVLRLMAAVIHSLWERQDRSLLIMPANIPTDDPFVYSEMMHYLEDQWAPVIETDVDGPNSLPIKVDSENTNLGRYSACRRVARTIYMGSAPTQHASNKGIDDRQVKLGCVQPGETVATFGDALRRLTDQATYLYVDGQRYWYSTQPTVTRLADDRANQVHGDDVLEEIRKRLRTEATKRGDFTRVHACLPAGDVLDEIETCLVILGPEYAHSAKDSASPALREASSILDSRGTNPRNHKNTLVFLAADSSRLRDLEQSVRLYIAWDSIWNDRVSLNLDPFQSRQAETKRKNADDTVTSRIPETCQWLLVPTQSDPRSQMEWLSIRLQGQEDLAVRASRKLKSEELLLTQMGGTRLRYDLDQVPLWRGDNVGVKQLAEDFAKYTYLPRLQDSDVLLQAISDGAGLMTWHSETFGYAERWDEQQDRYLGLQAGRLTSVRLDADGVVVKPDVAKKQLDADATAIQPTSDGSGGSLLGDGDTPPPDGEIPTEKPATVTLRRFHGHIRLDATRIARDAGVITQEVVQHFASLPGCDMEVSMEIHVRIPEGAPDNVIRTISENCRTLGFETHGFERE